MFELRHAQCKGVVLRYPMTLFGLILVLVVIGVILWAVQSIPMDATIRNIIRVVVIVVVVLWLAHALLGGESNWNPRLF